jgi:hypothetical protein
MEVHGQGLPKLACDRHLAVREPEAVLCRNALIRSLSKNAKADLAVLRADVMARKESTLRMAWEMVLERARPSPQLDEQQCCRPSEMPVLEPLGSEVQAMELPAIALPALELAV